MVRTEGDATYAQFCHENHPGKILLDFLAEKKKILLTVILQDFCYTCMDLIDMYMHIVSYIADD